jgi:hypothetical protein
MNTDSVHRHIHAIIRGRERQFGLGGVWWQQQRIADCTEPCRVWVVGKKESRLGQRELAWWCKKSEKNQRQACRCAAYLLWHGGKQIFSQSSDSDCLVEPPGRSAPAHICGCHFSFHRSVVVARRAVNKGIVSDARVRKSLEVLPVARRPGVVRRNGWCY